MTVFPPLWDVTGSTGSKFKLLEPDPEGSTFGPSWRLPLDTAIDGTNGALGLCGVINCAD
jgi:hypothetical protein